MTLTPLINEIVRFIEDFPRLAEQLDDAARTSSATSTTRTSKILRGDPRLARQRHRRRRRAAEAGAAFDFGVPAPARHGRRQPPRGDLRLHHPAGLGVLPRSRTRRTLVASFDRALPDAWQFDTWVLLRTVERDFGQWVRAQVILGFAVGVFTFIGLIVLSYLVDPIFGRYAILLSVIAGVLELVPVIGPIISAIPAVLLAATAGIEAVIAALVLYTLVQQVENNFLVPKIQGDATDLHPAAVIFAIIIGGALAGLLGAILALPILSASRDIVRYLFRRLSPDDPEAVLLADPVACDMDPAGGRGLRPVQDAPGRPRGGR